MPKKPSFPKTVTDALLRRLKVTKAQFNKDLIAALKREDFKKIQTKWWQKKFGHAGLKRRPSTLEARKRRWGYYKDYRMGPAAGSYKFLDWSGVLRGAHTDKVRNLSYWRGEIYMKPLPLKRRHKKIVSIWNERGVEFFNRGAIREALNALIPIVAKKYLKKAAAEVEKATKAGGTVSVRAKRSTGRVDTYTKKLKKIREQGGFKLRTGPPPFGRFV